MTCSRVLLGLAVLGLATPAHAETSPVSTAERSPFALVASGNVGLATDQATGSLVSIGAVAGARYGFVEAAALVELATRFFNSVEFYGAGVGPVLESASGYRLTALGGLGLERYCAGQCLTTQYAPLAFQGRIGLGKAFAPRPNGARLVVDVWFTGIYSAPTPFAGGIDWPKGITELGGWRLGAALGAGIDWPFSSSP